MMACNSIYEHSNCYNLRLLLVMTHKMFCYQHFDGWEIKYLIGESGILMHNLIAGSH